MASLKRECPCDVHIIGQERIESLPQYEWDTLLTENHIRVLRLYAGSDGQPLSGSLFNINLDFADNCYLALSYAWDGQTPKHAIQCDDGQLRITCNLFSALSRMRSERTDLLIFADGVSINQGLSSSNLQERASQVRMMNKVYARASKVMVNISEDPGQDLKDFFSALAKTPAKEWRQWLDDRRRDYPVNLEGVPESSIIRNIKIPPKGSPTIAALHAVLSTSWPTRLWMIQEYVLARHVEFMIGKHIMSAGELWTVNDRVAEIFVFEMLYRKSEEASRLLSVSHRLASFATTMEFLRRERIRDTKTASTARRMTLARVLYHSAPSATTNLRDRIYGLLGIITESDITTFDVDYTESVGELSLRLSWRLLIEGELGFLLQLLACRDDTDHPSWAIDLRRSTARPEIGWPKEPIRVQYEKYFKAGDPKSHPKLTITLSRGGRRLSVGGGVIDKIEVATRPAPPTRSSKNSTDTWQMSSSDFSWVLDSYNIIKGGTAEVYRDPSSLQKDFISTATAGVDGLSVNPDSLTDVRLVELDIQYIRTVWNSTPPGSLTESEKRRRGNLLTLSLKIGAGCFAQRMGITGHGKLCKVPENSRPGDEIAVIRGMNALSVLRPTEDGYKLIGNAYVHGSMQGEALDLIEEDSRIDLC